MAYAINVESGGGKLARPKKGRRVCRLPGSCSFGPLRGDGPYGVLTMTVEELEAIRQIDLEGLSQEDCAARMNVARTTAQGIYNSARQKLARCLVDGLELQIGGGSYQLCGGRAFGCCGGRCPLPAQTANIDCEEYRNMKIAVTLENGQVFQHFGHSEQFKLYDVADGRVTASRVVDTNGQGHGALAGFLQAQQVDTLICGGIGGGARMALEEAGIRLFGGVSGEADAAVEALLAGTLQYQPDVSCSHHSDGHGHDHACGSHGCGHGSCHS